MTAKYTGTCKTCGTAIKPGDSMVYSNRSTYCPEHGQQLLYGAAREASYEQYGTDVMADYR